jgi:hypothetical protein
MLDLKEGNGQSLCCQSCRRFSNVFHSGFHEAVRDAGPKDVVIIGRAAGLLTGKAVGYIQTARGHIAPIMQRSEINAVRDFPSYS